MADGGNQVTRAASIMSPSRCLRRASFRNVESVKMANILQKVAPGVEDAFNLQLVRCREGRGDGTSLVGISHRNRSPGTMKYRHRR